MSELSGQEGLILTRTIMRILDEWRMPAAGIINVIGLPEETRPRHLERFRGDTAFPDEQQIVERLTHLAGIADALRTMFPHGNQMAIAWMNKPNRRLANRTPVMAMSEDGLSGLIQVRSEVDCTFDWSRTDPH
jgi:uncharacterized protein (DUF2384 family)